MTREEAIRELKADYCGNRIICELYPDQCNREDCEIWWAIKALEKDTNVTNNDCISRQAVKEICNDGTYIGYSLFPDDNADYENGFTDAINKVLALPSAQPEITPDGTLNVSIDADIASVSRILLSQTGTQYGGLYYKDEQPEETCDTCKYGYFGDGMCDYCRVRYQSHYERRTDD